MNRAICIWLPEWPIQRLVVARPELESAPLVLHARDSRRGQRVVACCRRARERGVSVGMPLAEVAALSERQAVNSRFADAKSEGGDPAQPSARKTSHGAHVNAIQLHQQEVENDLAALQELAVWCEQFSPIVGLGEADFPECLLLDVTGMGPLFGGEGRLGQLIVDAFGRRGYRVQVGAADTVGAAWALARYSKRANKGDGPLFMASSQQTRVALEPLPIEALRLPAETMQTLEQLGVLTISQLLQLPRDGLATRLGEALIRRIDQALGQQPEIIIAHRPLPEFTAEWVLEHPTDRRDALETILSRLTEQVAAQLAENDQAAVQLEGWLEGQTTSRCLQVALFQPSSNPRHIDDLLRLQLETIQMRQPVQRVQLTAVTTVRITGQQHVLWEDTGQGTQRELALLVDRLSSRLGMESVFGVQAQAGALPERAYREQPLSEVMTTRRGVRRSASVSPLAQRPLWLHEPPQPLEMVSVKADGFASDGPPIFFRFQNTRHDVARYWGPERIETGWWRGSCVRRDYYRVETTNGYRFWLFRRLSDGAWFLHGCFE